MVLRDRGSPSRTQRHVSPHDPTSLDIASIRRRMRLTQAQFAGWFGFPVATLRHWERGNRRPTGAALVLLCIIADYPRAVLRIVRKVRMKQPELLARIERPKTYRAPPGFSDRPRPRYRPP